MSNVQVPQVAAIQNALQGSKIGIEQHDISLGNIYGTLFYRKDCNRSRGIVICPGIFANRYNFTTFAQRLAAHGFFCLAIDPPSHFLNPNQLRLGMYSQTVSEAVMILKKVYGVHRVGVVGHSLGALAGLFSIAGYDNETENRLYRLWEQLVMLAECLVQQALHNASGAIAIFTLQHLSTQLGVIFKQLEELIRDSLQRGSIYSSGVNAYVFVSMPINAKQFIPGLSILRKVRVSWTKKLIELAMHKPAVRRQYKEGNTAQYEDRPLAPDEARVLFLITTELRPLLEYLSKIKEPKDFLEVIQDLSAFEDKDAAEKFFEDYQNYIWNKPKLFVYGRYDAALLPFLPGNRGRIERFYKSCQNATVIRGDFGHIVTNDKRQIIAGAQMLTHDATTDIIMNFLDKNV